MADTKTVRLIKPIRRVLTADDVETLTGQTHKPGIDLDWKWQGKGIELPAKVAEGLVEKDLDRNNGTPRWGYVDEPSDSSTGDSN